MSIKIETIISNYVTLRDKRSALKKVYDAADEVLKADMKKLDAFLLRKLNEVGSDTFRCDAGTAYIVVDVKTSCADWPTFWAWCAENKRVDMLEKRVSSKSVSEYETETGQLPPAINVLKERGVQVRRG